MKNEVPIEEENQMHVLFPRLFLDFIESETDASTSDQLIHTTNVRLPRDSEKRRKVSGEEWRRLFKATCRKLGIDGETVEAAFARYFFRHIRDNQKRIYSRYLDSRELLADLPLIHREFAESGKDRGDVDWAKKLRVSHDDVPDRRLVIHYASPNKHCRFIEILIEEIVRFYGDDAHVTHGSACLKKGDARCDIVVTWMSETDS